MRATWILGFLVGACTTAPIQKLKPDFPYNPADYQWAQVSGPNSIVGSAWTMHPKGVRKPCRRVFVKPAGPYTSEQIAIDFGSTERGYRRHRGAPRGPRGPAVQFYDHRVHEAWREALCNPEGRFEVLDLPDGTYYVTAFISWTRPYIVKKMGSDSDYFMLRVELAGGEVARVDLHP